MGKVVGEGGHLRKYLKENRVNQEELALAMGYTGRHSLIYHFDKDILDYELKMKLRKHGVKLFDENGKLNLTEEGEEKKSKEDLPQDKHANSLYPKLIQLLEERVALESEKSRRLEEENRKLKEENQLLIAKLGRRPAN